MAQCTRSTVGPRSTKLRCSGNSGSQDFPYSGRDEFPDLAFWDAILIFILNKKMLWDGIFWDPNALKIPKAKTKKKLGIEFSDKY